MIKKKGALINILNLPSFEGIQDPNLKTLPANLVFEIQKYTAEQESQHQEIKIAKEKGVYKEEVIQYCKDSTDPKQRLIYETVVDLLKRKEAGEAITIKQIAKK